MDYFKKWNRVVGWLVFAVSAAVYLMTIEPTASMWDCAEFIATSYKLEVGHPPGAPLWMMIARVFGALAPSPQYVGLMVNAMSALCGAFTVLFLFWSITHLARRMSKDTWTVLAAGAVGALAYCFTDTQWFSAVEAEVYSMSSMFTALVFWCILKWEESADEAYSTRWLILIAYLVGLSIGVHILNLLCIPAIVLVYYFRKAPKVTGWGIVKAMAVAGAILVAINWIIIPYIIKIGASFDKMFVNGFGLPVNSGLVFWALAVIVLCAAGLWWTRRKSVAHTVMLCVSFILLGYSSYASMIIRAAGDPPMNSNDPSNAYSLSSVIAREQYGDTPLLSGPYYSSPPDVDKPIYKETTYLGTDGKYHSYAKLKGYANPPQFTYFFPRVWRPDRAEEYKVWANIEGRPEMWEGERIEVPTAAENMRFFFGYQLNYMYWRYFLWNFVGRQNDIQGDGGLVYGNWLSGIKFIDSAYLGPQDDIPADMKNNKARNTYFFLPFILGLIGLLYHLKRDKRNFAVVMMLFFMMGIALVAYFNTAPSEPRERDYVFVGSFYAFCIWLGLGVMAVRDWFAKASPKAATVCATVVCASVPLLLVCQNWDDHDRSHRYVVPSIGFNALSNTLPNSIIMNNGDNDTFPLWYMQEVEGVRPDVRIMNMSYIAADWYIAQMTRKYNESEPVPFSLPPHKWMGDTNNGVIVYEDERVQGSVPLRDLMAFIASDSNGTQLSYDGYEWFDYIPSRTFHIPVNKENALKSGIVREEDAHLMVDSLPLTIPGNVVKKDDLMFLDLLATFDWERPLYFVFREKLRKFGLEDYLQFDGFAYRLVPIRSEYDTKVDAEYLWHNLMELDRYGNVKDPRVYVDYFTRYTYDAIGARMGFVRLAYALLDKDDTARAVQALDRAVEEMPFEQFGYSEYQDPLLIQAYYDAGATDKANAILEGYSLVLREYIMYFIRFSGTKANMVMQPLSDKLRALQQLYRLAMAYDQDYLLAPMDEVFDIFDI